MKIYEGMKQELTRGEKLVGIRFNPSNNDRVHRLKELSANQINMILESQERGSLEDSDMIHARAVRAVMDAQMWAVKAETWNKDD